MRKDVVADIGVTGDEFKWFSFGEVAGRAGEFVMRLPLRAFYAEDGAFAAVLWGKWDEALRALAAVTGLDVTDPTLVFRVGSTNGDLVNRNGANALGLLTFLEMMEDKFMACGDTIFVFRLPEVAAATGEYKKFHRGEVKTIDLAKFKDW